MKTKLIFFGTHEFGAAILESLLQSPDFEITLVVTQPDRPSGRKQEVTKCAAKLLAEKHGLNVFQPESLKTSNVEPLNKALGTADLNVVCQYGLIIPKNIIDAPKFGSINVHTSLLPKYRGASPIQSALIAGEKETGVTIMQMDEKMDHGAILRQEKVQILPTEIYPELRKRMLPVAQKLLLETLKDFLAGKIHSVEQNESDATYTKILTREDGKINWNNKSAIEIYNLFRGLSPWPGIWTEWEGKRLKLLNVEPTTRKVNPGIVEAEKNEMFIGTLSGSIKVLELQLEGKKAMDAKSFLIGQKTIIGAKL